MEQFLYKIINDIDQINTKLINEFSVFGTIIIYILLFLFLKHIIKITIIGPHKKRQLKKLKKENRRWNKKITSTLMNKYDINFGGEYTLMIYDFIKTNVETISTDDKIRYGDFRKNDLLKYIHLDEEYHNGWEYNYVRYAFTDRTEKEIELIIYTSLKEIKDYLYTKDIHFPQYKLLYMGQTYCNIDNDIEEEIGLITQQIEYYKEEWGKTKFGNLFTFFFSLIAIFIMFNVDYVFGITFTIIFIILNLLIWGQSIIKYSSEIDPLNKKLNDLQSIPNDTYSLVNKKDTNVF